MAKILGLDLGTNSIGWAVVEEAAEGKHLVDYGTQIFQEGVAKTQSGEKPMVQDRTDARHNRRHYFRRRLRMIELLKVLIDERLCPFVSRDELRVWKERKQFPFRSGLPGWLRTRVDGDVNPYRDRHECLHRKLDLTKEEDRFVLGRALYHINQRRGFRFKEIDGDSEGKQTLAMAAELSRDMQEAGCDFLGDYYYKLFREGKKIRGHRCSREHHYEREFDEICRVQELSDDLKRRLRRAIFYQRPLKSQKGAVGHCTFEPTKPRCMVSHPRYEEFRMLSFLNAIRISRDGEPMRPLTCDEVRDAMKAFSCRSKRSFPFEDIAKAVSKKRTYAHYKSDVQADDLYNYDMKDTVGGCPVTAAIADAMCVDFAGDWESALCSLYQKNDGRKTPDEVVDDIWHALVSFDDADKLAAWFMDNLQISSDMAKVLSRKIDVRHEYASLSLKAIRKMLPWLRKGYVYSKAVFLANLDETMPDGVRDDASKRKEVYDNVMCLLDEYDGGGRTPRYEEIARYLKGAFPGMKPEKLYHPSMIDLYKKSVKGPDGKAYLGSPRRSELKNPVVMRMMFRLRKLVNALIEEGAIDEDTAINIELSRNLNSANMRAAIRSYQKDNEKKRAEAVDVIRREMGEGYVPTEEEITRVILWNEQDGFSLYTGNRLEITTVLNGLECNIDHIIPRALGGEDRLENKTLCESWYNQKVKGDILPACLDGHDEIMAHVDGIIRKKIEERKKAYYAAKKAAKAATMKDVKDNATVKKLKEKMYWDYWQDKYNRFLMKSVDAGFTMRQDVDTKVFGRYAMAYLKTVFPNVHTVKGATTAFFREAWSLQDKNEKKDRSVHSHHCIDAVTIACIGREEYGQWALYAKNVGSGHVRKPSIPLPWPSFIHDLAVTIPNTLVVPHFIPDRRLKKVKKKVRVRGKIQKTASGDVKYATGDAVGGALHNETFYGKIMRRGVLTTVVRKRIEEVLGDGKKIASIVDDAVREKVMAAYKAGERKQVWMNEEKGIPINSVRIAVPDSPTPIKYHREEGVADYKKPYYVNTNGNYCLAIYEGKKAPHRIYSLYEASRILKNEGGFRVPETDDNGNRLKYVLKVGQMVLFYENDPEEVYADDRKGLVKRLFKITGVNNRKIQLMHSLNALPDTAAKSLGCISKWSSSTGMMNKYEVAISSFQALVEGYDFMITETGKIEWTR